MSVSQQSGALHCELRERATTPVVLHEIMCLSQCDQDALPFLRSIPDRLLFAASVAVYLQALYRLYICTLLFHSLWQDFISY